MKNRLLTLLTLLVVSILLTGCVKKGGSTTANESGSAGGGEESIKSSLLDLVKSGRTVKCTFSMSDSNGTSSGTTYVSGNKSRSTFNAKASDGTEVKSNTLVDGDWVYVWSDGIPQGTKMKISDIQTQDTTGDNAKVDAMKNAIDYKCLPWIADNSKFIPPSDINFVDFTETMKQLQSGNKQFCSTCEQAGDTNKIAECKKNLGCE